jgi:hypothetical protein
MRADFKQESFTERCFNRIFKSLSFKGIGLELSRVKGIRIKEIVEVERIENYKLPLLMFLLEDDSLLHVEIINDEIKPDLQSMLVYDMSIVLRYGIRVKSVILNFGNRQVGKMQKNFGSVHYNAKIVNLYNTKSNIWKRRYGSMNKVLIECGALIDKYRLNKEAIDA